MVVYTAPQASLMLLFFNLNHPLLADRNVRQAIASAVDRQKLIDAAREGRARPADSPVLPGSWAYSQEARRFGGDPQRARPSSTRPAGSRRRRGPRGRRTGAGCASSSSPTTAGSGCAWPPPCSSSWARRGSRWRCRPPA